MTALTIQVDDQTVAALQELAQLEGCGTDQVAARLLARAVRRAKQRTGYDLESIQAVYAEIEEDEVALADSGAEERARLLNEEDAA